jgi:hypothetical protein
MTQQHRAVCRCFDSTALTDSVNSVQLGRETHLIGTSTCFDSQAVIIRNVLLIVVSFWLFLSGTKMGHVVAYLVDTLAISRKVAGSYTDEVNEFFFHVTQSFQMGTRSRKMFLWSRARPTRRINDLTAICKPIV